MNPEEKLKLEKKKMFSSISAY